MARAGSGPAPSLRSPTRPTPRRTDRPRPAARSARRGPGDRSRRRRGRDSASSDKPGSPRRCPGPALPPEHSRTGCARRRAGSSDTRRRRSPAGARRRRRARPRMRSDQAVVGHSFSPVLPAPRPRASASRGPAGGRPSCAADARVPARRPSIATARSKAPTSRAARSPVSGSRRALLSALRAPEAFRAGNHRREPRCRDVAAGQRRHPAVTRSEYSRARPRFVVPHPSFRRFLGAPRARRSPPMSTTSAPISVLTASTRPGRPGPRPRFIARPERLRLGPGAGSAAACTMVRAPEQSCRQRSPRATAAP